MCVDIIRFNDLVLNSLRPRASPGDDKEQPQATES